MFHCVGEVNFTRGFAPTDFGGGGAASVEEDEENKERNPRFNFDRRRMGSPAAAIPLSARSRFVFPRGSAPLFRRLSSCLLRKLPLHGDFEEKLGYGL